MEKQVKMAAKLYACRDAAKTLAKINKRDYLEMLEPYIVILKQVMLANNLEEIPALLVVSGTKTYQESDMGQLLFMAATVELIEPTETSIVRKNLMNERGYSPYCGNDISRTAPGGCDNPRTVFNGEQFECKKCGWVSGFPLDFITRYKAKWNIS